MNAFTQRGWAAWLLLMLALAPQWGWAQSVVFINPGRSNEAYWRTASDAMAAAAVSLGMPLEIRYAERNPLQAISIARELAARPKASRPRFVMFVNESSVAPEILRTLEAAQIDSFMAFNGIQESARAQLGRPRETFKHWLGSLEPQAEEAGYLTAKALIEVARASRVAQASDGKLQMLVIAGDRSTSSSIERNAGMRRAVAEAGDVVLQQEVFGGWSRERAAEQMRVLMQRYPQVRTVWAGNDEMALGAMDAWREAGASPGATAFWRHQHLGGCFGGRPFRRTGGLGGRPFHGRSLGVGHALRLRAWQGFQTGRAGAPKSHVRDVRPIARGQVRAAFQCFAKTAGFSQVQQGTEPQAGPLQL